MENLNIDDIDDDNTENLPTQTDKQKVIIFCVPGNSFNSRFVKW